MKTINIAIIMLFCITNMLVAQEEDTNNREYPDPYPFYEMPSFPGGDEARMKFFADNLVYSDSAKEKSIQGTVYVTFVVETDGSVSNVEILRGIGGGCDEEAVRVVKLMPKWNPITQDGKPVRVRFNLPIKFILDEDTNSIKDSVYLLVEKPPSFPGGDEARMKFIVDNIRYPHTALEKNIQGVVYVTFVVEADGSLTDVKVLRGIDSGCDEESVRVIKLMPKWNPGMQDGKPVRVQFTMPLKFTLN